MMREKFMMKHNSAEIFGSVEEEKARMSSGAWGNRSDARKWLAQQCQKQKMVILPHGVLRTWWDMLSCVLITWIAIYLPFRLAFAPGGSEAVNAFDLFIDIFFMVDVVLNMVTAYEDDGHLVTRHSLILKHYARTWLPFDLVSSFPFDWLVVFPPELGAVDDAAASAAAGAGTDNALLSQLLKVVRLMKLLRLLRIARLFRYLARFEELLPGVSQAINSISSNFVRLVKLTAMMFLFCHWMGCLQFLLAQLETPPYNGTAGEWPSGFPNGFHEHSWVNELEIATSSPWTQWEWSFFITVAQMLSLTQAVTTIRRSVELWGYIASILIGAVFYAVFTAVTTAVVADMDTSARAYRSRLDAINQYMIHSQLPRELRAKLRTYYQLYFPQRRAFDEDAILGQVSRPLRQEVCLHKCRSVLAALQLLDDTGHKGDKGLPGAISQELQRSVFVTGDYIIREGEETPGLFFVSAGLVELFNDADPSRILTTLGAGSMFGEMALLSQTGRAVASVRVRTFCEGYHLSKPSFNRLVQVYPSFKEYLESVARLRLKRSNNKAKGPKFESDDLQSMLSQVAKTGQGLSSHVGSAMRRVSMLALGRHPAKNADQRVNKLVSTLSRASKGSEYATGLQQMGYHLPDHRGSSALERLGRNLSNVKRWQLRAGGSASNSGQHPATPAASLDA